MKDAVEIAKADALWRRDLVDKADKKRKKKQRWGPASNRTAVGGALLSGPGAALGAATAAKHGHRTGVAVKAGTRSTVEGSLGALVGGAAGTGAGLITHNPAIAAAGAAGGSFVGGTLGSVHGGVKSVNNSRKLRQLRPGM